MMIEHLQSILDREHIAYSTISHTHAYGARYAASRMHIHGKEVGKTVVLRGGKDILLAVLPDLIASTSRNWRPSFIHPLN